MAKCFETRNTYPHLSDAAAFLDKADVNIWGKRRQRLLNGIREERNLAIGGPGRNYARCIRGHSNTSGNQLQIKYGVLRPYKHLSPFKLSVWAGKRPVMCADLLLILQSFMCAGYRAIVSSVELTFDVENIALGQFTEELCTRARHFRDHKGTIAGTFYVGGANSTWQTKFYMRTYSVGRIEFTLRSGFLRTNDIVRIHELYRLRKAPIWNLISFRQIDQTDGHKLPPRVKTSWTWLGHGLPPDIPAWIVLQVLRKARVDPSRWVVRSPREELLRKMQRNLVF